MRYNLIVFSGLLMLLTAVSQPTLSQSIPQAAIETVTITPGPNQMQAASTLEAPFAFNAVVPSWIAAGEAPEIHLRTSPDGQVWSDWYHVHAHDDWTLPGEAETIGDMIVVPAADNTHRFLQYEIHLEDDATQLSALSFTFIDTTDGPTTAELLHQQQQLDARRPAAANGYPRPTVISRAVWCTYTTCDDIVDLEYEPVTHLIVHHTVSSNTSANWAATVRAIYIYHRDTREWGDIGYNYLVDRTGAIYEGHMNEDYLNLDVVGIHAGGANAGSLGTSLIGTFTNAAEYPTYDTPPPAMMNAVADLFAWKADQRGIEIYDASRPVNMTWGLPHIMGHRDVYGGTNTLCPGGNAHDLLPWLRTAVTSRVGQISPYTFVSEQSAAFTKSNATWYETRGGCGWQGHAYYAWSTTNPAQSANWGQWRLDAPAAGLYEIQVYAPYCDTNNSETRGATYTINNGATTQTAVVSHQNNIGLWMSLGVYQLTAGNNNTLRLTNLTTTDSGVGVWFDDVRFKPVSDVTLSNVSPANNSWQTQSTVTFNWTIDNPSLVQATALQVATDAAFTNIIATQNWGTAVTSAQHTFSQDYADLYWRVSANTGGVTSYSTPTRFGLDAAAPTSSVTALTHHVYAGTFDVTWSGSDATSGIASYNVDYKVEDSAAWTRWLTDTLTTSGVFTPTNAANLIWFRSQARDQAGNVEAESSGDMRSDQAAIVFNPGAANTDPISGWTNDPNVLFTWALTEIDAVTNSTVTVAADAAFNNVVASGQTNSGAASHALSLPTNDGSLYWRVAVDFTPPLPGLINTVTSTASLFGLDTTPPTSTVTAVYTITESLYLVTTTGADAHAGISHINLEYQAEGDEAWTPWPGGAAFSPPIPGQTYYFRSQAVDKAGNVEPAHATADASTDQAKPVPHAIMLPVITK
ncbi:MAG: N-acetylmuramoyl-L-alanine amidase [Chloroflexota bacterium]